MSDRHPASRLHGAARTLANAKLRRERPGEFWLLTYVEWCELDDEQWGGGRLTHDRVRGAAMRELRSLYPARVKELEERYRRELRVAAGQPAEGVYRYVDGRRVSAREPPVD